MADDPEKPRLISVDFVAGKLSSIESLIAAHAQNTDRRFDDVEDRLSDQNRQHAKDKEEAKGENESRHAQNQSLWTATHTLASKTDAWVTDRGDPMWKSWSENEKRKADQKLVNKGRVKTWAKIASAGTLIVGAIGYLGKEPIAAALRRISDFLSSQG